MLIILFNKPLVLLVLLLILAIACVLSAMNAPIIEEDEAPDEDYLEPY